MHFSNDGNFCSARVRQAGTRGASGGYSTRMDKRLRFQQPASDRPREEAYNGTLPRVAVALPVASKFKAMQTLGEFVQPIVQENPLPNPLVELTRYGMAPRLPRACASRIVALVSQGATPQRSAHRER